MTTRQNARQWPYEAPGSTRRPRMGVWIGIIVLSGCAATGNQADVASGGLAAKIERVDQSLGDVRGRVVRVDQRITQADEWAQRIQALAPWIVVGLLSLATAGYLTGKTVWRIGGCWHWRRERKPPESETIRRRSGQAWPNVTPPLPASGPVYSGSGSMLRSPISVTKSTPTPPPGREGVFSPAPPSEKDGA